jgi:hypothetical protein
MTGKSSGISDISNSRVALPCVARPGPSTSWEWLVHGVGVPAGSSGERCRRGCPPCRRGPIVETAFRPHRSHRGSTPAGAGETDGGAGSAVRGRRVHGVEPARAGERGDDDTSPRASADAGQPVRPPSKPAGPARAPWRASGVGADAAVTPRGPPHGNRRLRTAPPSQEPWTGPRPRIRSGRAPARASPSPIARRSVPSPRQFCQESPWPSTRSPRIHRRGWLVQTLRCPGVS